MEHPVHVSLIIPSYNEEDRIATTLEAVSAYFATQPYVAEVLVVDDGSTDATAKVVADHFPGVGLLRYEQNRGKGYAVRHGMQRAKGAFRVFYDADASTPVEELEKMFRAFDAGADVVIGSRALPDSNVEIHQPWYRENMGRIFNLMLRLIGLTRYRDTQCGFKGFTADATSIIFPQQTIEGFGFDPELLCIAERHHLKVAEIPVRWLNSPKTRVNALTDSLRMFVELLTIRCNALRGRYNA